MIRAMSENSILQIVVFSLFVGVAITAVGEPARPLVRATEALVKVMLQITDYVMRFAPFAVFAAVASTVAQRGPSILGTYGYFMGSFYVGLVLLWILLLAVCFLIVGARTGLLVRYIRDPIVLAFSTASSEAAYPRTLEALDRFGVPPRIASFVLPLGYSFNLDGSMMYMTFATIFVAQAYGIELSMTQQILMLLTLMITSKGVAGVPRASLVVITATMAQFNIPKPAAADPGGGPLPRHGPLGNQRRRQCGGERGGGEVGRRTRPARADRHRAAPRSLARPPAAAGRRALLTCWRPAASRCCRSCRSSFPLRSRGLRSTSCRVPT
jgi:Na+/H+-dicarboxylate symporter